MKAQAVRFARTGGPEVLALVGIDLADPGPGEIRIRQTAIGLNFIDTYHRTGLYPLPLPSGLGVEGAGVVEAVGDGVTGLAPGDRIGHCLGPVDAYATHVLRPAARVIKLPDGVSDETAAAGLLKGCTVEFLVERCARVEPGSTVLVQAAAGGVGLLLVQWLKHIGARVIGTAGSAAKAALAAEHGADETIVYGDGVDVARHVREQTGGEGVAVVFDGVGKATWEGSIDSLRRRGLHISYGNASGPIGQVDFGILARKGSLFTTRPSLFDYYQTREELEAGAGRVLRLIADGVLKVRVDQRYPLADAARAHAELASRSTTGSSVLIP